MVLWSPPGHWSSERRRAHDTSIDFLRTIVNGNERMDLDEPKAIIPGVFIQGESGRWYWIDISIHDEPEWLDGHGMVEETVFSLHVLGATCKEDLEEENVYAVSICIGPQERARELPIGDQIAALALSLQNDTTTSLRIPLLSQFIVQPRAKLRDVYQFSHEGVMMADDVWLDFEIGEEPDDDPAQSPTGPTLEHLIRQMDEIKRQFEHDSALDDAYDAWLSELGEAVAVKETDVPWHHDEAKIWTLEDNLRKGRT